jgi:hypothetical protein
LLKICSLLEQGRVVKMTNFYDMLMDGILYMFAGSEVLFAIITLLFFAGLAYYFRINSTIAIGIGIGLTWAINGLYLYQNEQLMLLLTIMVVGFGIKLAFSFKNLFER